MKQDTRLILFEGKIFSTEPEDERDMFMGPDILWYYRFEDQEDEELFEIIDYRIIKKNTFSPNEKIFLHDPIITGVYDQVRKNTRKQENRIFDLDSARKVIVDEKYPAKVEYIRKFKRWSPQRKMALQLGDYSLNFGRYFLLQMIKSANYEVAIPELREIVLHDKYGFMVDEALRTLRDLNTNRSRQCLNSLLFESVPFRLLEKIVDKIDGNSFSQTDGLRFVFEKEYHYYPSDFSYIHYNSTIQQTILEICSKIPTLEALEILEMGIAHPYDHVERTSFNSIKEWIKLILSRIANGKDDGFGLKLMEIIKRYDFSFFNANYTALKKQQKVLTGTSW